MEIQRFRARTGEAQAGQASARLGLDSKTGAVMRYVWKLSAAI